MSTCDWVSESVIEIDCVCENEKNVKKERERKKKKIQWHWVKIFIIKMERQWFESKLEWF